MRTLPGGNHEPVQTLQSLVRKRECKGRRRGGGGGGGRRRGDVIYVINQEMKERKDVNVRRREPMN